MFYSSRLNLLFIAAPKTGSTSVEDYLLKLDPDGERFKISLPTGVIDSSKVRYSIGHATASELRELLGAERFDAMTTFGFVRHPVEKLLSAYHFTREGKLSSVTRIRTAKSKWFLASKRIIAILIARFLPFSIWSRIYTMKRCSDFFLDESGQMLVKYLGCTSRLTSDLQKILQAAGIDAGHAKVRHLNRSGYSDKEVALGDPSTEHLMTKYAEDMKLYNLVKDDFVSRENL